MVKRCARGFTLIEILVVLSIIMLLVGLAAPGHFNRLQLAKEVVLQQNLGLMRVSIDKFYADRGRFPRSIKELVDARYVNTRPIDPFTDSSDTWIEVIAPLDDPDGEGLSDVKSGADGQTLAGVGYGNL
jgi:general secretion pathway protein G